MPQVRIGEAATVPGMASELVKVLVEVQEKQQDEKSCGDEGV